MNQSRGFETAKTGILDCEAQVFFKKNNNNTASIKFCIFPIRFVVLLISIFNFISCSLRRIEVGDFTDSYINIQ